MVDKLIFLVSFACLIFLMSCNHPKQEIIPDVTGTTFQYLPENMVAYNDDSTITARYVDPTQRYDHGILGDKIEAGGLLVVNKGKEYYYKLDEAYVFEDLQPRLKDLDHDGEPEVITIQTSLSLGASVCVYKIINGKLILFVQSNYIGMSHRWLNIAAIDDLDNDGEIEIAWIQTPHIGGVLKIARIENDTLKILDETDGVSNHQIGSRNLCLSAMAVINNTKILYVPNNSFNAIIGFRLNDDHIIVQDSVILNVDATMPLFMQYNFQNLSADKNCIYFSNRGY